MSKLAILLTVGGIIAWSLLASSLPLAVLTPIVIAVIAAPFIYLAFAGKR